MLDRLDRVLEERRRQVSAGQRTRSVVASFFLHAFLTAAFLYLPTLLAEPPPPFEAIQVIVVPPALLGAEQPPPPPPPKTPPPPPRAEPPPPAPPKKTEPADAPVLPTEKKKPKPQQTPPPPPPSPPRTVTPPPSQDPPKREGSPFGSPFGASSSRARVGVEDPDFTYGYYLDRVVSVIASNWVRPPISGIDHAILYFRIQRDGKVTDLKVRTPSGFAEFDLAAQRAVETSSPLPPLPVGYKKDWIGINLRVH